MRSVDALLCNVAVGTEDDSMITSLLGIRFSVLLREKASIGPFSNKL